MGLVALQGLDPTSRPSSPLACFHGWKQAKGLFPLKPIIEITILAISADENNAVAAESLL
jgi:hypothetical protein